ncbi:MAG: hypothetical protein A2Y70_05110, partial [Candidatus Aminicenantes bacterium RBG_13_64_14]
MDATPFFGYLEAMDIYAAVEAEIERRRGEILALSHEIHARPELSFEEKETSLLLQATLEREGFAVSAGTGGLETAFRAVAEGAGGGCVGGRPRLIYTAEMDALPGLGHGCGHNIIAAAAVWSAAVLKTVMGGTLEGSVEVVGTPAEERGSGKVALIEAGVFDGADAVLQMHPHALDTVVGQAMARRSLSVEFFGRKAHAAAAPGEGRNALDALVLFYHSLILQPGKLPAGCLLHGVIEEGGEAPNIIPGLARGRFSFRTDAMSKVEPGLNMIREAARAAAATTGCTQAVTETGSAATTSKRNAELENLFAALLERRGRKDPVKLRTAYGSTDLANVSHVCPTIEIMVKAGTNP